MSIQSNFPVSKPSLMLDFADTQTLDPRITFTRSTTATYYDGVTTAKAEENLLLQSQTFQTTWSATRATVTSDSTNAPDGTLTADSLLQTTGQTVSGVVAQTVSVSASSCVISIYAKPNGKNFIICSENLGTGSARNTWFDVSTGTVGTTAAGQTAVITASTNGFYRCQITFTPNAARSGQVLFYVADADNSTTVVDSGGLYIWGAQLEQRLSVTAYTPTTTQPITNYIPVLKTAAINTARFDHNPVTSESLGLLIEEARTNLLTYSEQFDNAIWIKARSSITANTIVAPDGALTGDKLVEDTTASNSHICQYSYTATAGASYTWSIYAKAGERTRFRMSADAAIASAYFDLSNGTVISGTGSIQSVGNGWYRCSISTASSTGNSTFNLWLIDTGTNTTYTGNGYSGIYIWGAQLEAGAFATSYIPTVAATVTRNADVASMTGTNFSSWYNQNEGTVYSESSFITAASGANRSIYGITDGSTTNSILLTAPYSNTSRYRFLTYLNSVLQGDCYDPVSYANNTTNKNAAVYKVNDFALATNGASPTVDTSGTLSNTVNQLSIGSYNSGTANFNGTIKKLAYYPVRLSNTNLQALTS